MTGTLSRGGVGVGKCTLRSTALILKEQAALWGEGNAPKGPGAYLALAGSLQGARTDVVGGER